MFYSPDGTRAVEVIGDDREAFLYDLTTDRASQGQWLAAGVFNVRFIKEGDEPSASLRQIELQFADTERRAVVDVNGERRIVISGPDREAMFSSLEDDSIPNVLLGQNVIEIMLYNDDAGQLKEIEVAMQNDDEITRDYFTRDGLPSPAPTSPEQLPENPVPFPCTRNCSEDLSAKFKSSPAFQLLKSGLLNW